MTNEVIGYLAVGVSGVAASMAVITTIRVIRGGAMTEPKEQDEQRQEQATEGEQEVPRISGGPELSEAEVAEDDKKRKVSADE